MLMKSPEQERSRKKYLKSSIVFDACTKTPGVNILVNNVSLETSPDVNWPSDIVRVTALQSTVFCVRRAGMRVVVLEHEHVAVDIPDSW